MNMNPLLNRKIAKRCLLRATTGASLWLCVIVLGTIGTIGSFARAQGTALSALPATAAGALRIPVESTVPDTLAQRLAACTACHGKQGRAGSDGYYPRIAGKPAGYLYNQLVNFREGRRQYPLMIYIVDHLPDSYLHEIADYFAGLHPPYAPLQPVSAPVAVLARGQVLAQSGDQEKKIPACIACHGQALTGVEPTIPGLLGLPRDYVNAQFGAWKNGSRHAAAPDCMALIAQRLSIDDISAASAWLAAQPIPVATLPASPARGKLPIACGSLPQ